uniref:Thioredoxin domain-containing protein n=1 Tax=Quercus lobata TaxID=97700 RepID=A0A7N2QY83_QUELO
MQRQSIRYCKAYFGFGKNPNGHLDSRFPCIVPSFLHDRSKVRLCLIRAKIPSTSKTLDTFRAERIRVAEVNQGELSDEDDDLCPAECVREFKTDEELSRVLEKAKETDSLVVVDFYRPSCGSCKYIEQGFGKLCRGSGDQDAPVIFLKHNVIDEYDEQSEVADRLRIKMRFSRNYTRTLIQVYKRMSLQGKLRNERE